MAVKYDEESCPRPKNRLLHLGFKDTATWLKQGESGFSLFTHNSLIHNMQLLPAIVSWSTCDRLTISGVSPQQNVSGLPLYWVNTSTFRDDVPANKSS